MTRDDVTKAALEGRIRQVTWPEPDQALRARVLASATLPDRAIPWTDRVYFSRGWRFAAAAAALVLMAVGPMSGPWTGAGADAARRTATDAELVRETSQLLGLPADVTAWLAHRPAAPSEPAVWPAAWWLELPDEGGGLR